MTSCDYHNQFDQAIDALFRQQRAALRQPTLFSSSALRIVLQNLTKTILKRCRLSLYHLHRNNVMSKVIARL